MSLIIKNYRAMENKVTDTTITMYSHSYTHHLTGVKYYEERTFKKVDEFPEGAVVWNIGRSNFPFPGFVPVAFLKTEFYINPERLFAVRCKDEETALKVIKLGHHKRVTKSMFDKIINS